MQNELVYSLFLVIYKSVLEGFQIFYDLLKSYPGGRLGAFNTVDWESGHQNNEVQYYKSENAVQDPYTGEIVITAEKGSDGKVYSARYKFLSRDLILEILAFEVLFAIENNLKYFIKM